LNKKLVIAAAVLAVVLVISVVGVTLALSTLLWNQNPSVPGTVNFAVTTGSTTITAASDQTNAWTYHSDTHSFTMPITITNNNNAAYTPTITAQNVPSGWTFTKSTLSAIAANGGTLAVTLTITASGVPAAGPIGAFTVTVS
jgi:hypothetical protein